MAPFALINELIHGKCPSLPADQGFSADMSDFCTKMLQRDPKDRPEISECLTHPWIVGGEPKTETLAAYFQTTTKDKKGAGGGEAAFSFTNLETPDNCRRYPCTQASGVAPVPPCFPGPCCACVRLCLCASVCVRWWWWYRGRGTGRRR